MDKMDLDLLQGTPPVLIALTGLLTFTAVLVGCVYTRQKQSRRGESYKVAEGKGARDEPEGADEDESEEDRSDLAHGRWPVDSQEKGSSTKPAERDPIEFCSHIPSEVRKTQQRIALEEAEKAMDDEAKAREREIQREQLAAIFNMMEQQKEKFGVESMDDIQEQMKLYTVAK